MAKYLLGVLAVVGGFQMVRIVLASGSPARENLLRQIGLPFKAIPSKIPELRRKPATPEERVQLLALEKAKHVASRIRHGLVIGADTVVAHKEKVIGKPRNLTEARKILKELSGSTHDVITGIAIVDAETSRNSVDYVKTSVKMRRLTKKEIEAYLATGEPLGRAGAYAVQGKGATLIERIEGCYYNVVGLPLPRLADMLKKFGTTLIQ